MENLTKQRKKVLNLKTSLLTKIQRKNGILVSGLKAQLQNKGNASA
eukprot:CAMPEP_0170479982 /NCGR_PEP_ID=MMETSP0208-20121228/997_1 /TAXON_ID=197538 /ORGANISM="Strombidium inclinatum, Strain S3" /LENGTH=45 /DNA_ID= /DNA_START= /DNA_END= /DNA_ORIENTATION=